MKVSHEQYCGYYIHPYYQVLPTYPIIVIVHQHSKILSLCFEDNKAQGELI